MDMIKLIVRYDPLVRLIIINLYCCDEKSAAKALKMALGITIISQKYDLKLYNEFMGHQKEDILPSYKYGISFSLLYQLEESRDNFLNETSKWLKENHNNL